MKIYFSGSSDLAKFREKSLLLNARRELLVPKCGYYIVDPNLYNLCWYSDDEQGDRYRIYRKK